MMQTTEVNLPKIQEVLLKKAQQNRLSALLYTRV